MVHDINENFVHGPGQRLRKQYRYVYALFSAKGFTKDAQDFALAQQISLVDLSGASFAWLRDAVERAAAELHRIQAPNRITQFPVNWMRGQLRWMLGTLPALPGEDGQLPETSARQFVHQAEPLLSQLVESLWSHQRTELLLGFPSAPFILPLAASDAERFLDYAQANPEHHIQLRRTGQGSLAEWTISPLGQPQTDSLFHDQQSGYELTFNLPDHLETWIGQHEEHRISRTRAVKKQLLSDIVIYRMESDNLRTYQLHYDPGEFRRHRQAGN